MSNGVVQPPAPAEIPNFNCQSLATEISTNLENLTTMDDSKLAAPILTERKRPYEGDDYNGANSKRSNYGSSYPLLKVLVPNYAAGAIIGKNGQNISQLQSTYGAKIKLSPNNDYYPASLERVAVLTGEVEQVIDLHKYVMDKVRLEPSQSQGFVVDRDRVKQVKIIVPNATAGLLIGKGGSTIRSLSESSGAKIFISNKDQEKVPGERIVTITGSGEQNEEACRLVIGKIATDPENMMNKNVSYNSFNSRKLGRQQGDDLRGNSQGNFGALSSVIGSLAANKNPQSLLATIGLSGGGLGGLGASNPLAASGLFGAGSLAGGSGALSSLSNINIPQVPHIKTVVTVEMHVPDVLVGAIMGKSGKTVHEFMQYSGAKIQFSGKGEYVPGTNDRVLTIQGDMNSAQVAHFLVCQKIIQAESEHPKHGSFG